MSGIRESMHNLGGAAGSIRRYRFRDNHGTISLKHGIYRVIYTESLNLPAAGRFLMISFLENKYYYITFLCRYVLRDFASRNPYGPTDLALQLGKTNVINKETGV